MVCLIKNVIKEEIEGFCEKFNLEYYEVSALKGTNFECF